MSKLEKRIIEKAKKIVGTLPPYATPHDKRLALNQRLRFNKKEMNEILKKV